MDRLKEPSSWAGAAGVAEAASSFIPPQYGWVAHLLAALFGTVAVHLREAK